MTSEPIGNPYVGPQTFTEAQSHLFFGREREASDLYARVLSERLVLFYSQSGAGKSSLINTRLIPRLRDSGYAVLPVARVGGELPSGLTKVDNIYLFNLMLSLDSSSRDPDRFVHMHLKQFLAGLSSDDGRRYVYEETVEPVQGTEAAPPSVIPYVLIIDQFEELITSNPKYWDKREKFFEQLNQAMMDDPKLWVLLSFREDYLAPIETYAPLMTDRMRARFYMERMGIDAALEAVCRPAELGDRPFASGVGERLVDDLCQVRVSGQKATIAGQFVEPVQLQVACYQLWKNVENRPLGPITENDLLEAGDVDQALIKFYDDVLTNILAIFPGSPSERRLRTWFEQELITPDRTRGLVRQGEDTTGDLPNAIVAELQKRFIVRSETRSGATWIEIVHDRFVEPILASNGAWRARNQNPLVLAAEVWLADGKHPRRLLTGEQIRAAESELDAAKYEINEEERLKIVALLEASKSQERQRTEMLLAQKMAALEPQKYISEMGWGVIFPGVLVTEVEKQKEIDAIKEALQPLLDHRKTEATLRRKEFYREFSGIDGYRSPEMAKAFLDRQGVGPGKVDPSLVPYYLLLVGDPKTIPFDFQYQLGVQYAVGRVHFDTLEEYRRYAESVVQAETGTFMHPRRIALFAPRPEQEQSMKFLGDRLIKPLVERLKADRPEWSLTEVLGDYATKARLSRLLGGDETPALVFIAGQAMTPGKRDPREHAITGAPVCQDWPGSRQWKGPFSPGYYFAADDLSDTVDLLGVIVFAFLPFGAGAPAFDSFYKQNFHDKPSRIVEHPFVARLPQRLLSHPGGGALAFIGHIDMTWGYSFVMGTSVISGVRTYAYFIEQMLDGYPVGAALEAFKQRYAQLATMLTEVLNEPEDEQDAIKIAQQWTATIDARNWIVIGDPAVRLMVSGLRPDMESLRPFYEVEDLRSEGDRLAEAGNLAEAEAKYQEVLLLNPWLGLDPKTEGRKVAARMPMRMAQELAKEGKIEESVVLFEKAQRLDPGLSLEAMKEVRRLAAPYFRARGKAAARSGKYKKALELLEQAAELDPNLDVNPIVEANRLFGQYCVDRGRTLAKKGNVDKAISYYKKACKIDPGLKSEFDPALDLEPKTEAGKYAAQFFEEQGTKLAEQGDREQAVAAFRKVIELDPSLKWKPESKAARLVARYKKQKAVVAVPILQDENLGEQVVTEGQQILWFNGVDAATGEYSTPPMVADALVSMIIDLPRNKGAF